MSQDMLKLAERCEAATGPDPKLDREILDTICEKWVGKWLLGPAKYRFTASLDAAMTLYRRIPERVPANPRLAAAEGLRQRASQGKD